MAVKYLAGNRIQGTNAERVATSLPSGTYTGWKEIGRTTLSSAGDVIDVGSLPNKRYYMVIRNIIGGDGNMAVYNRLNGDTGSNYAYRQSENSATDSIANSQNMVVYDTGGDANDKFDITYISNLAGGEKLAIGHGINRNTAGVGTAPGRGEFTGNWANRSHAITTINTLNDTNNQSGNFNTGSEVVVLGYDPTDTNTTDFWQELKTATVSSGDNLDSGIFTPKKYMWVQAWGKISPANGAPAIRVGNNSIDTGSNYAYRASSNGGNTGAVPNACNIDTAPAFIGNNETFFINMFIVNDSSKEKLMIWNIMLSSASGASNAPTRRKGVSKWVNTSNQINNIRIWNNASGDYSNGQIKVWGHD